MKKMFPLLLVVFFSASFVQAFENRTYEVQGGVTYVLGSASSRLIYERYIRKAEIPPPVRYQPHRGNMSPQGPVQGRRVIYPSRPVPVNPPAANRGPIRFIRPVPGPITQGLHHNGGIDFDTKIGTPVRAAATGKVTFAYPGWNHGSGNLIVISHGSGIETRYGHLSKIMVRKGEWVQQGTIIALAGNTGSVRAGWGGDGSHLHFSVRGTSNPFANEGRRYANRW